MAFRKSRPWENTKPPVGAQVDWGDPINKGLVNCLLFNEGAGGLAKDIARGKTGTLNGNTFWSPNVYGNALKMDGAGDYVNLVEPSDANYIGALTILVLANIISGSTYQHFAGKHLTNGSQNNPFDFRTNNVATPIMVSIRAGYSAFAEFDGPAVSLGITKQYGVIYDSNLMEVAPTFVIGNKLVTGTLKSAGTGAVTGIGADIRFGSRADGEINLNGYLVMARIFARALLASEVNRIYTNPFAGILAPRRNAARSLAVASGFIVSSAYQNGRVIGSGVF